MGVLQKFQLFVESGTWTAPETGARVTVIAVGGGNACDSNVPGEVGETTSFGSLVSASGGGGQSGAEHGKKGCGLMGFGDGGESNRVGYTPSGGDAGEVDTYSGTVTTDQTVTIGAGGERDPLYNYIKSGRDGAVFVWWEEL